MTVVLIFYLRIQLCLERPSKQAVKASERQSWISGRTVDSADKLLLFRQPGLPWLQSNETPESNPLCASDLRRREVPVEGGKPKLQDWLLLPFPRRCLASEVGLKSAKGKT